MIVKRENAFIRQVKDITLSSALTLGLLAGTLVPTGCGPDRYETVYTQGVQTYITEVDWGEFKITDEKIVGEGESRAIVKYLDGRVDTLSMEEARRIVDLPADSTSHGTGNHYAHGYHPGLRNALFYGSMGYMLGRSQNQPASPGVYASPEVYNRAHQNTNIVRNSRVSRPVHASRGFFRSSGRSFGG